MNYSRKGFVVRINERYDHSPDLAGLDGNAEVLCARNGSFSPIYLNLDGFWDVYEGISREGEMEYLGGLSKHSGTEIAFSRKLDLGI